MNQTQPINTDPLWSYKYLFWVWCPRAIVTGVFGQPWNSYSR